MRILLVEDDNRVADALTGALRRNGYEVRRAANAAAALAAPAVDLVLLDLGLPDRDGIEVCRELRARGGVPVIAVTARGGEPDKVRGLRSGADDYVVKPFGTAELLARIEAVLRRSMGHRAHEDRLIAVDGLEIDLGRRTVTLDGQPVPLTRKEFDILAVLVRADGAAVPRDRIVVEVWQTTYDGMSRTLDVHVTTLRGKLGRAGSVVRTVRGFGYRLATSEDTPPTAPQGRGDAVAARPGRGDAVAARPAPGDAADARPDQGDAVAGPPGRGDAVAGRPGPDIAPGTPPTPDTRSDGPLAPGSILTPASDTAPASGPGAVLPSASAPGAVLPSASVPGAALAPGAVLPSASTSDAVLRSASVPGVVLPSASVPGAALALDATLPPALAPASDTAPASTPPPASTPGAASALDATLVLGATPVPDATPVPGVVLPHPASASPPVVAGD